MQTVKVMVVVVVVVVANKIKINTNLQGSLIGQETGKFGW